jgi:M6 family metalloprotease-like protein
MENYPKYLHINKSSSVYGMQTHNGGDPWAYLKDALIVADPVVDFSTYDFVVVIPPSDIKTIVYGPAFPMAVWDDQLRTNEKVIKNATVAGSDSMLRPERSWFWLSHEVGHLFGLEHSYSYENVTYSSQVRGIWDLMETGDLAPEFLSWHRFVLGWLDSSRVSCLNRDSRIGSDTIHFISPLEAQDNQLKSVIIRLNDYEAIVVELRRNLGFDTISEVDEGVVVYKVNVRDVGKAQEVTILTNQPYEKGATITGNLLPGDKVIDSSVEITVLKSTTSGDYIKVKMLKP